MDNIRSSVVAGRGAQHHYDGNNRMAGYVVPGVVSCYYGYDARGNVTQ